MSQFKKLLDKLNNLSGELSWNELTKLLYDLGFDKLQNGKTSGSRCKFYNKDRNIMINLHKPHPSPYVKDYVLKQIRLKLLEEEMI